MSDSPEFQLFLSMKRYFQFQQAVHKDRDNTEDAQKRSNAHAILQYCESVKTEMWDQLNSKLMPLMESNKISQSLSEPRSDQDFDVLEFLMRAQWIPHLSFDELAILKNGMGIGALLGIFGVVSVLLYSLLELEVSLHG
ncbi:hypothetical protein ACE6H2_024907 [Prunus campanulata]